MGLFGGDICGVVIEWVCLLEDFCIVYCLVYDVYMGIGFIFFELLGIWLCIFEILVDIVIFVVKVDDCVVGVFSVVSDFCDFGFLLDFVFKFEFDVLCVCGLRLCEFIN